MSWGVVPGWACRSSTRRGRARPALHGPQVAEIGRVPRRDRFGSAPRSVPARSLSPAGPKTTGQPSNGPDAGRVFTVWDRLGSARRRPRARPRDSKDRSKALRVAPTRLPRIVNPHPTLRTPPPADRRPSTRGATPRGADTDRPPTGRTLKKIQAHNTARTQNVNAPETSQHALTHLQVRGASRQDRAGQARPLRDRRLNAPTGAWCFPTGGEDMIYVYIIGLNAPTGAWCFPTLRTVDDVR